MNQQSSGEERRCVVTTAAKGSAPKDETVMIVSGRNVYDAFGRVAVRCQTKVHTANVVIYSDIS